MIAMILLAHWRQKRRLSQRALAKLSKVSFVTIARLETGQYDPRISTLRRLARALKVKVKKLLDE
jgi:transcriptional regulator with XRE-family HTH domain